MYYSFYFCSDNTDFGRCQSGTSGLIFDDDNAIIGAPGTMQWRGAIFVFSVNDDYLLRDKTVYIGNGTDLNNDALERIKKDGYMGQCVCFRALVFQFVDVSIR